MVGDTEYAGYKKDIVGDIDSSKLVDFKRSERKGFGDLVPCSALQGVWVEAWEKHYEARMIEDSLGLWSKAFAGCFSLKLSYSMDDGFFLCGLEIHIS